MDLLVGIVLLATYVWMVVLSVKGKNLTTVFFFMTLLWSLIAVFGKSLLFSDFFNTVIANPAKDYGANIVSILMGALFGRILVETNIAGSIVRRTAELGGDKAWLTMILLSVVTSLICSSVTGLGIVMAIGVIIIPILLSLGIDKKVAVAAFALAIGSGAFFNPSLTYYLTVLFPAFDITSVTYRKFAFIAYGVNLTVTIVMAMVLFKRSRRSQAWAARTQGLNMEKNDAPALAMVTPLIPLILCFGFGLDVIPAMLIAMFAALICMGYYKDPKQMERTVYRCMQDSIADSALLIVFLIAVAMFNSICTICAPYFQVVIGGIIPKSSLVLTIALIVLTPAALYRGPLSAYGSGVAIVSILAGTGYFQDQFLYMLLACTSFGIAIIACPTQSWVQWTLNYVKENSMDHIKVTLPWCWIMTGINMMFVYFMFA